MPFLRVLSKAAVRILAVLCCAATAPAQNTTQEKVIGGPYAVNVTQT